MRQLRLRPCTSACPRPIRAHVLITPVDLCRFSALAQDLNQSICELTAAGAPRDQRGSIQEHVCHPPLAKRLRVR
jgi:hypothetical protein